MPHTSSFPFIKIGFSILSLLFLMTINLSDSFFLLLSIINSTISIWCLFSDHERPYTIHKLVNLFILLFFVYANAIQYANGSIVSSLWLSFSKNEYQTFQIIVLFILLLFNLCYYITIKTHVFAIKHNEYTVNQTALILVATAASLIVLRHYRANISELFIRGFEGEANIVLFENSSSSLLFEKFLRVFPIISFIIASLSNTSRSVKVYLFILAIITVFPTGLARNAIIMYWLPCILIYFHFLDRKNVFVVLLLIGILVLFPFMESFRRFNGQITTEFISLNYLDTMSYDASQEFMAAIKMHAITYGKQLLGALLFFVPRRFWPTKPIGSGAFIAQSQFAFSNISMPFWGEGYVNFGWFGILLFTLLLSFFAARMDYVFWETKKNNIINVSSGYYYIILGAVLFIMRGDLMSSFAYLAGVLVAFSLITKVTTKKIL